MPRRPRISLPNVPLHIIQRGNNRQACFFADEDYLSYLEWLHEYAHSSECFIHAYVLMTNHVHLLLTPKSSHSAANLMKRLGQRYVQYFNRTYRRSGTLWEGRFRSSLVQQESYLFTCQRYIEMNPVRAKMVEHPGVYRWSSFRANAQGERSELITPHMLYLNLGVSDEQRQTAYRELFRYELDPGEIDRIREATNGNFTLGTNRFQEEASRILGRRVSPGKTGRPRKKTAKD
ncbi:transposase [Desulfofustis glycolicus]|uniref:Putative transposase n=1 Tax=Desulfofustis glycolicus DSM 9705 TaxID=1121409 RepID=A0A1M5TLD5_9BACT|nr:transposase [Desulfofustis glycolicus]MCB2216473.1 transposase [Desulfobulbaceae bacterium]SHH51498.1 putative transposase [Desulfofustis glycolicus DSM 9705]